MFTSHATRTVSSGTRLEYWNALFSDLFPGMAVDGARDIEASWTACRLDTFGLSQAVSQRATAQRGRHPALFAGDLTLCAPDEPYEIELSPRNAMFVDDFPWDALEAFGAWPGLVLRHQMPAVGVLRGIFEEHLDNGALRTGTIAQGLGVPVREVQLAFAELATTASDCITSGNLNLVDGAAFGTCNRPREWYLRFGTAF